MGSDGANVPIKPLEATIPSDWAVVPNIVSRIATYANELTENDDSVSRAALAIGVQSKMLEAMLTDEGSPKTATEIAQAIDAGASLADRILRHLAAMGYGTETGPQIYKLTNFSRALTIPIIGAGYPSSRVPY
ncbi:hypothetical protein OQA88_2430 [Cercophora sp. LCS_1]